jgi:hypothetical protein
VSETQVEEDVEGRAVRVRWNLVLRAEAALGDEVVIAMSTPLAVHENPFAVPPDLRYGPVHFPFTFVDQVDLSVSWSEEWEIDLAPKAAAHGGSAGRHSTTVKIDSEERTLTAGRRLELNGRDFKDSESYSQVRKLYQASVTQDAETLVLIRH